MVFTLIVTLAEFFAIKPQNNKLVVRLKGKFINLNRSNVRKILRKRKYFGMKRKFIRLMGRNVREILKE